LAQRAKHDDGGLGVGFANFTEAVNPSISGISMSIVTTSGGVCSIFARAIFPVAAVLTI